MMQEGTVLDSMVREGPSEEVTGMREMLREKQTLIGVGHIAGIMWSEK